jgi:general stress protein CsbA
MAYGSATVVTIKIFNSRIKEYLGNTYVTGIDVSLTGNTVYLYNSEIDVSSAADNDAIGVLHYSDGTVVIIGSSI